MLDANVPLDFDFSKEVDRLRSEDLGFMKLPHCSKATLAAKEFCENVSQKKLVVIGMGGSSMGAKAILQFVPNYKNSVQIWNNSDPIAVEKKISLLEDLQRYHFLFISKSGKTLETLALLNLISDLLLKQNLKLVSAISILTESKESVLSNWAQKNCCAFYEHPNDIGGRFSVLSSVGLLPIMFAGIDVEKLLDGAKWALEQRRLINSVSSFIFSSAKDAIPISVLWFYNENGFALGQWLTQLWSESLGKISKNELSVSMPTLCLGTREQHSVLQQFLDGPKNKNFMFFNTAPKKIGTSIIKNYTELPLLDNVSLDWIYQKQLESTRLCLEKNNFTTARIEFSDSSEKTIGAFIMLFEICISIVGYKLGFDPFDQPGVEKSKLFQKEYIESADRLK